MLINHSVVNETTFYLVAKISSFTLFFRRRCIALEAGFDGIDRQDGKEPLRLGRFWWHFLEAANYVRVKEQNRTGVAILISSDVVMNVKSDR